MKEGGPTHCRKLLSSGFSTRDPTKFQLCPTQSGQNPLLGFFRVIHFSQRKGISHFSWGTDMLLPRPLSKSQRLFLRTGARCGCTQSVGSLGSLQGFACPSVLGCKRPFSVLAGVPHMSQLQSLLEDTSCPGSDIEDRFQHMAPEGRHPHRTFSSKTNAYQPPTPPSNTLLGSAHLKNPKPTDSTYI